MSPWSNWSECSKPCGNGKTERNRVCLDLEGCTGKGLEMRQCNTQYCESWGSWTPAGDCQNARMCGIGQQAMTRTCNGGMKGAPGCQGQDSSMKQCNLPACPSWSAWGSWTPCQGQQKTRSRGCPNGVPGSTGCEGASTESTSCWGSSWQQPRNGGGWQQPRNGGGWSQWGEWGGCMGSKQTRSRSCQVINNCRVGSYTENRYCSGNSGRPGNQWGFNNWFQGVYGK